MDKRQVSTFITVRLVNPVVKAAAERGIALPEIVILETIGRKSGQPRRTPVGDYVQGDTAWIFTEHGRKAGYVRNIQANPRVRLKVGRNWRMGTAHLMPEDDAEARRRSLGTTLMRRMNAAGISAMATEKLTVRIDLDPQ